MQVFRHVLEGDNVENTYNVIEGLHSYDLHLNHDYRKYDACPLWQRSHHPCMPFPLTIHRASML